jgi:hypothetical protein
MRDGKPQDEFTKLNQQKETELNYVDEKIAVSEFSYLAHLAPRLRVPTPDHLEPDSWYVSSHTGQRCITQKALNEFKDAIQRAKEQRWQFWQND